MESNINEMESLEYDEGLMNKNMIYGISREELNLSKYTFICLCLMEDWQLYSPSFEIYIPMNISLKRIF